MLCFRECPVAKKLMDKRGGGEYQDYPSKNFRLIVPKNFVEEPVCVSEKFWYRKILCFRELCHDIVSKFLSHSAEKFRGGTLLICVSENFW